MAEPNRVVIVGGGGHARVCADILLSRDDMELVGYTDRVEQPSFGFRYLGEDSVLSSLSTDTANCIFVAIGSNQQRLDKIAQIGDVGMQFTSAISPSSIISSNVEIGAGVAIMPGAVVNVGTKIGPGTIINTGATVDHDCVLGTCAHIGPGVNLAGNVEVGDCALMGVGSCAIPGVKIGKSAVIGAGAAVISNIPDFATAVGVPARVIKVEPPVAVT
jgi:UDP-perosamine 4-acetyltransferase